MISFLAKSNELMSHELSLKNIVGNKAKKMSETTQSKTDVKQNHRKEECHTR